MATKSTTYYKQKGEWAHPFNVQGVRMMITTWLRATSALCPVDFGRHGHGEKTHVGILTHSFTSTPLGWRLAWTTSWSSDSSNRDERLESKEINAVAEDGVISPLRTCPGAIQSEDILHDFEIWLTSFSQSPKSINVNLGPCHRVIAAAAACNNNRNVGVDEKEHVA